MIEQFLELHVNNNSRRMFQLEKLSFSDTGKLIVKDSYQVQEIAEQINKVKKGKGELERFYKSSDLNALALIERINHYLIKRYLLEADNLAFSSTLALLNRKYSKEQIDNVFIKYNTLFSSAGKLDLDRKIETIPLRELFLEEIILLKICNNNQAAKPYKGLFDDSPLVDDSKYTPVFYTILQHFDETPSFGPQKSNLIKMLMEPSRRHPNSLQDQIEYMKEKWPVLTDQFLLMLLRGIDMISEENKAFFNGPGPTSVMEFTKSSFEEEDIPNFSRDSNWMPEVILLAKNALVWLDQLSRDYKKEIRMLSQIPDEELDLISSRGINCLWLIGIWNRSNASKEIKKRCGNPDAVSSAYSLFSYDISWEIGGWDALTDLRNRCLKRGIRLASDMVPNHTGIDSEWTRSKPDWFIQTDRPPFPSYTYNSENISEDPAIGVYLEDHYYDKSDAAVTFKRVNFQSGETRYIYHGNDGTSMPWNDTAQLDFLRKDVREAVIDQILHVARNFPVIRFDAAMTLAKKHIKRLWYPEPGKGGDIASRSRFALSNEEFENAVGGEFWKDVVARVASEVPETLLLAEAFWMMEGYFVRNLGMHRVYNSAFMNMLKDEENDKYRETIKNTLNYDRKILKRFVNFMNNPDEETAAVQFGTGDKYFGVMTLMLTLPGLPMIGHGQIEGYKEKYGMEFKKPLWDEYPDPGLVERHENEIFPILRKRYLFVSAQMFRLYDLIGDHGSINENVYAYSNRSDGDQILVLFNNCYERASGFIKESVPYFEEWGNESGFLSDSLGDSLGLTNDNDYYCLLKEIKTGLWYIRNNRELFDCGMYVALNGYKSQVFIDIHELKNSESNHIAEIAAKLNGSGTKDLDREYRKLIFKPIYSELDKLINQEILSEIEAPDSDLKLIGEKYKEQIRGFVEAAKSFSSGTGKVKPISETILSSLAENKTIALLLKKGEPVSELFLSGFTGEKKLMLYLIAIFEQLGPIVSSTDRWSLNREILERWMIIKYLRDFFQDCHYSDYDIQRIVSAVNFFAGSYNREKSLFNKNPDGEIFKTLQEMKGFSPLLGINSYEKTLWFSKEKFDEFLWWVVYKNLMEQKKPNLKKLNETLVSWKKASVKSEYDFKKFLELIEKK